MSGTAGLVLAGRYRLIDQVAEGAMGEVWRAHDDRLDRDVAVKVLRPELADDPDFLDRFRAEARHAASVRHPHVAAVHDYGEDSPDSPGGTAVAYLVMDLLDGRDLGVVLHEAGPLPERRVAGLLGQVADALAAAHATGLVHRDVKPANLVVSLVRPDDVTVTDFGIARAADAVPVTRTGLVMGTAEYLSPEQAQGGRATSASDVYSLGAVAYELLAGRPPFTGGAPAEVARAHVQDPVPPLPSAVGEAMRATVLRCLAKRPQDRPDAAALAARLRTVAEGTATADDAWTAPVAGPGPGSSSGSGSGSGSGDAPVVAPPAPSPPVARTREIPVVPAGRAPGRGEVGPGPARGTPEGQVSPHAEGATPTTPGRQAPRGPRRAPLRAPLVALLALAALLLLASVLQQTGLLGARDDPGGAVGDPLAHVTGSPWPTTHEDGR